MIKLLLDQLKENNFLKLIVVVIIIANIFLPGILFIYEYFPRVFADETSKLIIFSAAITFGLQFLVLSANVFYFLENANGRFKVTEYTIFNAVLFSGIIVSAELLIAAAIHSVTDDHFNLITTLGCIEILNVLIFLDATYDYKKRKKELKILKND